MAKRKYEKEVEDGLQTEEKAPEEKVETPEEIQEPIIEKKTPSKKPVIGVRFNDLIKDGLSPKKAVKVLYSEYGLKETEVFAKTVLK